MPDPASDFSLAGKKIFETWRDVIRFNNDNKGVLSLAGLTIEDDGEEIAALTEQSKLFDGAGNSIPMHILQEKLKFENVIIDNAVFNSEMLIQNDLIDCDLLSSFDLYNDGVFDDDKGIQMSSFNVQEFARNRFIASSLFMSASNVLEIDLDYGDFFVFDQDGSGTSNIEILNAANRRWNTEDNPNGGHLEIFCLLFADNHDGNTITINPTSTITPILWDAPSVFPATNYPSNTTASTGCCLFSLQTFDQGNTWHGTVIAKNVFWPVY